ncbi:hypothetical protein HDC30_005758 [Pseudomonas sp. JAI115]|uniref:Lar family restriction alleviation protein n=1 Tax=Pseudomonas sp. JAI115 TaxID=2723061 RepID=UPI001609A7AD|nr:Lar family restriction alleviation protein [Pseudomonas sp. JAI115]MBB6158500.1 hypothetical protein [Pseudomonas sp. JAI115]
MTLQPLPPDALELRIATHPEVLLPCPFCGRAPLLVSATHARRRPGPSRYQVKLFCVEHCPAQFVLHHQPNREAAQRALIAQWNLRVPACA